MKGKQRFTKQEAEQIRALIREKNRATPSRQKEIRNKIRNIGFYYTDFSPQVEGYTVAGFDELIKSGQIEIIEEEPQATIHKRPEETKPKLVETKTPPLKDPGLDTILPEFKKNRFDPKIDSEIKIPGRPGNYIVCLRNGSVLPPVDIIPKMKKLAGLNVIYTGIASKNLRKRDYRQHFTGNNAGRSTLRKSIGSLMGLKKVPRDKNPASKKTKYTESDEAKLSHWMASNLVLFFYANNNFNNIEEEFIQHFNPPLNLQGNDNPINRDFRSLLSKLRSDKK